METIIIEKKGSFMEFFDLMKWVLKAKGGDKATRGLHYIHIAKNRVVCCDGYVLFYFRHNRTFKPGNYELKSMDKKSIVLSLVEDDPYYPTISNAISRKKGRRFSFYQSELAKPGTFYTKVVRNMDENCSINYDYFSSMVTDGEWKVNISGEEGPVIFRNCEKTAVISPMKLNY